MACKFCNESHLLPNLYARVQRFSAICSRQPITIYGKPALIHKPLNGFFVPSLSEIAIRMPIEQNEMSCSEEHGTNIRQNRKKQKILEKNHTGKQGETGKKRIFAPTEVYPSIKIHEKNDEESDTFPRCSGAAGGDE